MFPPMMQSYGMPNLQALRNPGMPTFGQQPPMHLPFQGAPGAPIANPIQPQPFRPNPAPIANPIAGQPFNPNPAPPPNPAMPQPGMFGMQGNQMPTFGSQPPMGLQNLMALRGMY